METENTLGNCLNLLHDRRAPPASPLALEPSFCEHEIRSPSQASCLGHSESRFDSEEAEACLSSLEDDFSDTAGLHDRGMAQPISEAESLSALASCTNGQAHSPLTEASLSHDATLASKTQRREVQECSQRRPSFLLEADLPSETLSSSSAEKDSCCDEELELSDDVKREMITDICKGVSIITCRSESSGGSCHVYLIGTAHVSEESCREVQAAVRFLKPEVVFLELCQKRISILQRTSFVVPSISDLIATWRQKKTNLLGLIYGWLLAKVAAKLDVHPGAEFRAAYEEGVACGAKVVLGDRDVEVTLRRTWGKMSAWCKTKFIVLLLYQSIFLPKADQLNELIEKLKDDADILKLAFEELGKFSPTLMETVITERDLFMTAALQKIAENHSSIVAVVGKGHVQGINKYWGQEISIHRLLEVPPKRSRVIWRVKTYVMILLVAFASLIVLAFR